MSKLRLVYIASLLLLGVLLAWTIFGPLSSGSEYSEVAKIQLIEAENEYIVEFDIINHEGNDRKYSINAVIDGRLYNRDVLIHEGRMFTYVHHIRRDNLTEGKAHFVIFKEGEDTPFEQVTFYLKGNQP